MELDGPVSRRATSLGVAPAELHGDMRDAVHRLMRALCSDAASQALGPGILREILFMQSRAHMGPPFVRWHKRKHIIVAFLKVLLRSARIMLTRSESRSWPAMRG
ncbi:hypothetical protein HLM50_19295 [Sulfitobacter sp. Ks41]|nr:hypothetical protein [Sulfitobacter sp. Ks41]